MTKKTSYRKTAAANKRAKPIRVGIIGVGRGASFAAGATDLVGMKLVALCDSWKEKLAPAGKKYGVATYTDYDKFLEHDMDAVILANYFHEHAPFAIKALAAGKHVMSECSCNATLAEGVALCRAVEKSGKIYMLAENYPYTRFNMEMQRLYRTGEIGRVAYAEGEYNHPCSPETRMALAPGLGHWRNWLPSTYYCTHALAPLMAITDTRPLSVNGLSIVAPEISDRVPRQNDPGSVILCRMDNGAVFRLFGTGIPGHSNWYRVHGTHGAMEMTRGPGYFGPGQVRVWHEPWNCPAGTPTERTYLPDWPKHGDLADRSGHGGGDFWTNFEFANAIRSGRPPYLDVYRGVAMSSVGILAWKSALANGAPFAVPDFRKESSRRLVENDHGSPFPSQAAPGQLPSSIRGLIKLKPKIVAQARKLWAKQKGDGMKRIHRTAIGLLAAAAGLGFAGLTYAGSLDSPAAPSSSNSAMFTLEDLYQKIDKQGNTVTPRSGAFAEPAGGPTNGTFHSLNDIMALITNRAPIPKTGQTITYAFADDGTNQIGVAWPSPRFSLEATNGPGTNCVIDNLTGLMWTRDAGLPDGSKSQWAVASTYCNDINYGGHNDWRIPSVTEFRSLFDYGRHAQALPAGHPFIRIYSSDWGEYWTCNSVGGYATEVNPYNGEVPANKKLQGRDPASFWSVRGGMQ